MNDHTVEFKYKFPDDYNPKYVNGAYGGIGPRGELVVNFYLERQPIPKEETYEVTKKGVLGGLLDRTPEDLRSKIIRFIQTGVVLNLESAKIIHKWLGDHIKSLEQAKGTDNG
ncbi:hypothetical protein ES703_116877 [subsurface metagenome]